MVLPDSMRSSPISTIWLWLLLLLANAPSSILHAQSIDLRLETFFQGVIPELYRENNHATDSIGSFRHLSVPESVIADEIRLYQEAMQAPEIDPPTPLMLALCQNLLIHAPATGSGFLQVLDQPTEDDMVRDYLEVGAIASGEAGERMAVGDLRSQDMGWRLFWSDYLQSHAIYESSVKPIEDAIAGEVSVKIKVNLLHALATIGSPSALAFLRRYIAAAHDDELQATAMGAYVEIAGARAMPMLARAAPGGPKAIQELRNQVSRIAHDSTLSDRYDLIAGNDLDIGAGSTSDTPTMRWLRQKGLAAKTPSASLHLTRAETSTLLDSLIASRGLGIWMVKGTLRNSISRDDLPKLLRLRAEAYYSPGQYSAFRARTIAGLVRYLRELDASDEH